MLNKSSMVLLIDNDAFSNATLSHELRKLTIADSTICTTSVSNAMAYLHKQLNCNYPFPSYIFYNPHKMELSVSDFIGSMKIAFGNQCNTKLILVEEKTTEVDRASISDNTDIHGFIKKPISTEQVLHLFRSKLKKPIHT